MSTERRFTGSGDAVTSLGGLEGDDCPFPRSSEFVGLVEVKEQLGEDIADQLLGFRRHFTDPDGTPTWLATDLSDVLGPLYGHGRLEP
jgi:hypothetical protein